MFMAAERLKNGKAPGQDGIPSEAIKVKMAPEWMLNMLNGLLSTEFPSMWKLAGLVLIPKGSGKAMDDPTAFRPLSIERYQQAI
ncbi:hypothetical protein JTB14_009965 [Gonioctena quinquepunctata]|nr:hypothetical protein JTB14_009965 [Gonioctena quinquepunctata]